MSEFTLTVVDTTGIQDYIFGSNNLKHNVGASHLVHKATQDWVYDALRKLGKVNINEEGKWDGQQIEVDDLDAEHLYSGGGKTFIIFRTQELAKQFTRTLTRHVLLDAPGLQLVVAHEEFDWNNKRSLSDVMKNLGETIRARKMGRQHSVPLLGLGVTADCQFTGLPAVAVDDSDEQRRISAEVQAKLNAVDEAHAALVKRLQLHGEYGIPKDFDDFGRTEGESSYIAVVHTDGNGMGKRIEAIAHEYTSPNQNRDYIEDMRQFSKAIRDIADKALKKTTQTLIKAIDSDKAQMSYRRNTIHLQKDDSGRLMIPFRPIVFGGDDVTFVCDGRLGLTLTEYYLRQFTESPLPFDGKPMYARAGIAVVKTHYPFARAYQLAEALTGSAKKHILKEVGNEKNLTAIDWHFAVNGFVRDLKEVRDREYTVDEGSLLLRPLHLDSPETAPWHSWALFVDLVDGFSKPDDGWAGRRNKLKALREVLRDGPPEVKQFLHAFGLSLPKPEYLTEEEPVKSGWRGDNCVYYDAVEALDFFVRLEGASE